MTTQQYSVKGLKTWNTDDGGGYQVVLCRDGKPVAEVTEGGYGGPMDFRWKDSTPARVHGVDYQDKPMDYLGTVEEAALWRYVRTLPLDDDSRMTPEMLVARLVDELELEKQVKRWLKKFTILDGTQVVQWKLEDVAKNPAGYRDHIKKKYPDAIFLNDLPLAEAIAAVRKLQQ